MQRIYDTKQQNIVDFNPLEQGKVGMYVCGPTVQSAPHIGHLRSALAYDVIRRWFQAQGKKVTFIRNVTDIDDKILDGAKASHETGNPEEWWALAYRVEKEFTAAYEALGVMPPTYEPRATANVAQMHELIQTLIEKGHAYEDPEEPGNVYFDTRSWKDYGALTRQSLDEMESASDSASTGKKDRADFALWKAWKETEPISATWDSPWGRGRPGWHIECSAMAKRYLGETFDIHGGGLDLRFPHHENEMAQSNAAGDAFARHWIHNGLVNTGGKKMSKSLGNSLFAHDLLAQTRPIVLRFFLIATHYRSVLEYTENSLQEAENAFSRIESVIKRLEENLTFENVAPFNGEARLDDLPEAFKKAMFDDFGTPEVIAEIHVAVTRLNTLLEAVQTDQASLGSTEEQLLAETKMLLAMLDVLGLDPRDSIWQGEGSSSVSEDALEQLVSGLIREREEARENKDFELSDKIRDRLAEAGVTLEDHTNGTRWSLR